jgi:NAD(P) transhydrogenase
METLNFDLVVLGAGPAGENGAATAGALGKRVALVDRRPELGGASANTGTLPSKTLRETALAFSALEARDLYGVDLSLRREATVRDLMYHEEHVKENERERIRSKLARNGVKLFCGEAAFVDPWTVRIAPTCIDGAAAGEEVRLHAERILIATGSSPTRPSEFPFEHPRVWDSDGILQLERIPKTMAVVGAGVIGSEYACTFAALGVKVHVFDGRNVLLPFLDAEVSAALASAMAMQLRMTFHWEQRVTRCEAPGGDGDVVLTLAAGEQVAVEAVLVAAGRHSNTGTLNLAAAGIAAGAMGLLVVDKEYRTSVGHIYAAGYVIGFPGLAATSAEQARVAVSHAFGNLEKAAIAPQLPTGIYTIPEVSCVGETEETLKAKQVPYVAGRASYANNARGEIIGDRTGFLKLLFGRADGKLLGVHVIGEHATELVHVGLVAMHMGATTEVFNSVCFNYPTLGDLYKSATYHAMRELARGE